LLSSAVNRGDLQRLNYIKPFSRPELHPGPCWERSCRSSRPISRMGMGIPPPPPPCILLPSRLWTQERLVLLLNWYFLDQCYASGGKDLRSSTHTCRHLMIRYIAFPPPHHYHLIPRIHNLTLPEAVDMAQNRPL